MGVLKEPLRGMKVYNQIMEEIQAGNFPIGITGCAASQKAHLIGNLSEEASCRLVVAENEEKARKLYEDLHFFDKNVLLYPSRDLLFYSADVTGTNLTAQRMRAVKKLALQQKITMVASIDVLMEKMVPREAFIDETLIIDQTSIIDTRALRIRLVELGYVNVSQVEVPGDFSIRGDIVDIYPLTEEDPVRIELWGDEIDSIRSFNPHTQRSIENIDHVMIMPASFMILPAAKIGMALSKMREEYALAEEEYKKNKEHTRKERLRKMVRDLSEELTNLGTSTMADTLLHYFYDHTETLLDYLPTDTAVYVDEPMRVAGRADTLEKEYVASMECRIEEGYILPGQADVMIGTEECMAGLAGRNLFLLTELMDIVTNGSLAPKSSCFVDARSIVSYNNSFPQLIEDLKKWKKDKYRVILLSSSVTRARRLAEDIRDCDIPAYFSNDMSKDPEPGSVMVGCGLLNSGFEYLEIRLAVLSEKDIFKEKSKAKKRRDFDYQGNKIHSLSEIQAGDYVIHERYGLGIYQGIEQILTDGVSRDYINIAYKDDSNLFIPAFQLDIIQKYTAVTDKKPKLNSLSGTEWERTKTRVRSQIAIAAKDLVDLYAKRQAGTGFHYSPDTVWQREFEELFPYEETDDQLVAIEDTKADMESDKIMDRLICGDVGYGKTEIAIRAAFKAVMDSRQVVYLVPTTILAQQHYNTFTERMKHYPITIRMLSRFCTDKETREIKKGLSNGEVDIVIGTHKVLSKTVLYKNLGLLIIDEEQRFGVGQKEKIKQLKNEVDVLSLSATPIPRTLHMSMSGIRDMSVLEIPPVDRRAIQTYVLEYNEEMVREAIMREINRDGQVYYVYNKVNGIETEAAGIAKMLPDVRVAYAHGQMGERQLEAIMYAFINREIDVLVSTTIIETGLDIPNVNTIIIKDAQNFGLSQLYQLRGRVGRSNRRAYAFMMYRRDRMLTEVAHKRLKAIREFTDLGSGFKIAMRDLEIRGAGNLLGAEQSGHMDSVGYELYCKMLNEAVKELSGQIPQGGSFHTSVDLFVDAFIPAEYVEDEAQKLELYKRIAMVETRDEYEDMTEELTDRYGDVPMPLLRLLEIALLKAKAHSAWILSIEQRKGELHFEMNPKAAVKVEEIDGFMKQFSGAMSMKTVANPTFIYKLKNTAKKDVLKTASEIVDGIAGLLEKEGEKRDE